MLSAAHNPVEVAELEHSVCGTGTTADNATPKHLLGNTVTMG
jgi:hypothetical protein